MMKQNNDFDKLIQQYWFSSTKEEYMPLYPDFGNGILKGKELEQKKKYFDTIEHNSFPLNYKYRTLQTLQSDGSIDYTLIEKSEDTYMRKPKTPIEYLCNYGCYNAATMQLTLNKIESLSKEEKEKYEVNISCLKESLEAHIYANNGAKTFIESNPRLKFYKQIENSPDWESSTYTFTIDGKFQPKNVHCYISSAIEYAFNIVFDDDNLIDLINKKVHLSLEIDKHGLDPLTEWIEKNLDAYPTETYSAYNIYSTDDFLKVYDWLVSLQAQSISPLLLSETKLVLPLKITIETFENIVKRYNSLKQNPKYKDVILIFTDSKFKGRTALCYICEKDAEIAGKILKVKPTKLGLIFNRYYLEEYLSKLTRAGYRVGIIEEKQGLKGGDNWNINFIDGMDEHELFGLGSIVSEPTKQIFYENLYNQLESIVKDDSFEKNGIRKFILSHIPEDYKNDDIEGIVEVFYQRLRALKFREINGLGQFPKLNMGDYITYPSGHIAKVLFVDISQYELELDNGQKRYVDFRIIDKESEKITFKDYIVLILYQNGYVNGKDYTIKYFKSSPYWENRGVKNVQECWIKVKGLNLKVDERDFDDIKSLTNYICAHVDPQWHNQVENGIKKQELQISDLVSYKGFEETIFQIVGFKGNNYIVIELGDRTRTKNEIPFADKDKLQKVLPPILKHEAMLASSKKTLSGISGIKHKITNTTVSPIIIAEAKLAKLAQITLQRASNLVVDYERYGKTMVFEIANKKDAVNTPFMLAEDFFDSHPESRIPVKFNFDIEDIKPKYAQDNLLQRGADIYFSLFPKGVRDMYIMELQGGKIVATTKYKSRTYRPYEYIKITDLKSLGVSSLNELIVTDINKYFDLFRKGRELLSSGDFTGKKSDKRNGVDWLKGKDANSQTLTDTFGLRSIMFGTTKSKEMSTVTNNAYNGFMDLSMVCGFKSPLLVSHKGSLALNFGAKKLGDYAAYYRPANKSLNLTRTEGSGSFAHEWFHSLDNYLGILYNIRLCPEYNSSFISWCSELSAPYNVRNKKLIDIAYQWGKDMRKLSLYEPSAEADRRKKRRYWSTPHEVSARCFSYYVLRKLAAKGYSNDYLVDIRTSKFYPQPVDEAIIMKFFDNFFKALQTDFDKDNNMPYLYGAEPDIPEIENAVSAEKMAQIPQTEAGRRTFLENELQRYKGEVYSKYFNQNVKILGKSINEICKWAAIREESVIAALNIDGVIANATYVNESEPHNNTQKKKFRAIKMYELHCVIKGFGTAKLMVAEQVTGTKITYCITEIQI